MPFQKKKNPSGTGLLSDLSSFLNALPDPTVSGDDLFKEQIVPLETWLYDHKYMGLNPSRDPDGITLSKIQFEMLESMECIDPRINIKTEFVAIWGKGGGKDFIAALAGLRKVYQLLCMRNPYAYYGLVPGTGIQIVNVAYTKDQAKFVFLKQVKGLLNSSPWFSKKEFLETAARIKFDHEIEFVSTSADGDGAEGQNIFFAVMDEAAAFKTASNVRAMNKSDGQKSERDAESIYKVLRSSTNSRFPNVGKVFMISYPRYRGDFIEQKGQENQNAENGFVSGPYCTWEVNPRIKESDFAEDFARNPEMADSMYKCNPPLSVDGYVVYPERFINSVMAGRKSGLMDPFTSNGQYKLDFQGIPGKYYAMHVDLALNKDRCAIALARQGEPVQRARCVNGHFNYNTEINACVTCGLPYAQWAVQELPTMVVTMLKYFNKTGERNEVNFAEVRQDILYIRDKGHKIFALTYDGWQSQDSRQTMSAILGNRRVHDRWGKEVGEVPIVSILSVDRNMQAHDTLKEFIYDERFFIYMPDGMTSRDELEDENNMHPVSIAYREWSRLRIINGKKVDHSVGSSKDIVDALAGCAVHIANMPISRTRKPMIRGWSAK